MALLLLRQLGNIHRYPPRWSLAHAILSLFLLQLK